MAKQLRPRERFTKEFVEDFTLLEDYPTSHKFVDLSGNIYGGWKVLKYAGKDGGTQPKFFCECISCDEGVIQKVYGGHLKRGISTSCGCELKRVLKDIKTKDIQHHQRRINDYSMDWSIIGVIRKNNTTLFDVKCKKCDERFEIRDSSVKLKSGGCKCTMKTWKGFDYNSPAYFYIFEIKNEDGKNVYWKYGVTQKSDVTCRNFNLKRGYSQELKFSVVIKDRWCTIGIEQAFKDYFNTRGKCNPSRDLLCGNGYTECWESDGITLEDLLKYFWKLKPQVIPFCEKLSDIVEHRDTITTKHSIHSGVVKFYNLNKKQRSKYYYYINNKTDLKAYQIDLTNIDHFKKLLPFLQEIGVE